MRLCGSLEAAGMKPKLNGQLDKRTIATLGISNAADSTTTRQSDLTRAISPSPALRLIALEPAEIRLCTIGVY
jgi:hypothetical protein